MSSPALAEGVTSEDDTKPGLTQPAATNTPNTETSAPQEGQSTPTDPKDDEDSTDDKPSEETQADTTDTTVNLGSESDGGNTDPKPEDTTDPQPGKDEEDSTEKVKVTIKIDNPQSIEMLEMYGEDSAGYATKFYSAKHENEDDPNSPWVFYERENEDDLMSPLVPAKGIAAGKYKIEVCSASTKYSGPWDSPNWVWGSGYELSGIKFNKKDITYSYSSYSGLYMSDVITVSSGQENTIAIETKPATASFSFEATVDGKPIENADLYFIDKDGNKVEPTHVENGIYTFDDNVPEGVNSLHIDFPDGVTYTFSDLQDENDYEGGSSYRNWSGYMDGDVPFKRTDKGYESVDDFYVVATGWNVGTAGTAYSTQAQHYQKLLFTSAKQGDQTSQSKTDKQADKKHQAAKVKTASESNPHALPQTGDASAAVAGLGAVGSISALFGAIASKRRKNK